MSWLSESIPDRPVQHKKKTCDQGSECEEKEHRKWIVSSFLNTSVMFHNAPLNQCPIRNLLALGTASGTPLWCHSRHVTVSAASLILLLVGCEHATTDLSKGRCVQHCQARTVVCNQSRCSHYKINKNSREKAVQNKLLGLNVYFYPVVHLLQLVSQLVGVFRPFSHKELHQV